MSPADQTFTIVMPAKNEAQNLESLLPRVAADYPQAEIIVVNDGSTDETEQVCRDNNVNVITHLYSRGNGASIKTGARHASHDIIVFMDGDGQHNPDDIRRLLEKYAEGYDMVVGARDKASQASFSRFLANSIYNKVSSWISGHKIADLTSGFRAVNREKFLKFLYLLPNGFSYPTTITMAFFRAGFSLAYVSIKTEKRKGESHINIFRDGIRFFLIIFKIGTLYSPLKIFFPMSALVFLSGIGNYIYTFVRYHAFTNMSAVLFLTAMLIFLFGLISEQITMLLYKERD